MTTDPNEKKEVECTEGACTEASPCVTECAQSTTEEVAAPAEATTDSEAQVVNGEITPDQAA